MLASWWANMTHLTALLQTAQAVRPHLRGEVGEMAEEAEAESAEPDDAEAQDSGGHAFTMMHYLACPSCVLLLCVLRRWGRSIGGQGAGCMGRASHTCTRHSKAAQQGKQLSRQAHPCRAPSWDAAS